MVKQGKCKKSESCKKYFFLSVDPISYNVDKILHTSFSKSCFYNWLTKTVTVIVKTLFLSLLPFLFVCLWSFYYAINIWE